MDIWWLIIYIIDTTLFVIVAVATIYISVFSIASLFSKRTTIPQAKQQNHFIVIIPSHRQDSVIEQTVKSVLGQTYPQRYFDITVVSDHQKEITNFKLAQYPITLLTPDFKNSTKTRLLQLAVNNLPQFKIYDIVVVIDAGSIVAPEFLQQLNDAYESAGTKVIQTHCLSKNRDTAIANLDAIFEEINNTIFRRGHINIGISSAIASTGTAYDYKWFANNIMNVKATSDDKEIEALLMRQHIFLDYFDDIHVYAEKKRATQEFNDQRGRWASTQLRSIMSVIKYLPSALFNKQYDLLDKIIQWLLIPRTLMMAIIVIMSAILPFIYLSLAIKWWILFAFVMFILAIAVPDYLVDKNWDKSFLKAPFIIIGSLFNVTRLMKKKKNFDN